MRIAVINTGGTIGSIGDPLVPMEPEHFRWCWNKLVKPSLAIAFPSQQIELVPSPVFTGGRTLDSTDLHPLDWCTMAGQILSDYDQYDAWIVLHGTDTLAYSASALSLLLSFFDGNGQPKGELTKPVILTGSQLPLFEGDQLRGPSDAWNNLFTSVAFALQEVSEVSVSFGGRLLRGNRTVKADADRLEAFASPNYPSLGSITPIANIAWEQVRVTSSDSEISLSQSQIREKAIERLEHIARKIVEIMVIPLSAFPTSQSNLSTLVDSIISMKPHALILESYGKGNFPQNGSRNELPSLQELIQRGINQGTILVNCTQCFAGTVDSAMYGAGSWLKDLGVVDGGNMTSITALVKAIILCSEADWAPNSWSQETIAKLMGQNLVGELS